MATAESGREYEGGQIPAYVGYSYRMAEEEKEPSVEAAVINAVERGLERGEKASWWEISRIQAEVEGHNQWVKGYRVTITPTG